MSILSKRNVYSLVVDCSTATISGPYGYNLPSPATQGVIMSVTCQSGYQWSIPPYPAAQNATCTNISGQGQWVIFGGASCLCMFTKIYTSIIIYTDQGPVFDYSIKWLTYETKTLS